MASSCNWKVLPSLGALWLLQNRPTPFPAPDKGTTSHWGSPAFPQDRALPAGACAGGDAGTDTGTAAAGMESTGDTAVAGTVGMAGSVADAMTG